MMRMCIMFPSSSLTFQMFCMGQVKAHEQMGGDYIIFQLAYTIKGFNKPNKKLIWQQNVKNCWRHRGDMNKDQGIKHKQCQSEGGVKTEWLYKQEELNKTKTPGQNGYWEQVRGAEEQKLMESKWKNTGRKWNILCARQNKHTNKT